MKSENKNLFLDELGEEAFSFSGEDITVVVTPDGNTTFDIEQRQHLLPAMFFFSFFSRIVELDLNAAVQLTIPGENTQPLTTRHLPIISRYVRFNRQKLSFHEP